MPVAVVWGHSSQPGHHKWRHKGLFSVGFHNLISLNSLTPNNWWAQHFTSCGTEVREVTGQGFSREKSTSQKWVSVHSCLVSSASATLQFQSHFWLRQRISNGATVSFQVSRERFYDSPGLWRREVWSHSAT